MDVIILTGGLGTRLKTVVKDIPKTMVKIDRKPFLSYILESLEKYDVENVILAVGYKKEIIKKYFGEKLDKINIIYSEEEKPLGTGGAIKKALELSNKEDIIVINGDVFQDVDLNKLMNFHKAKNAEVTITLKYMENFDRYGAVEFDKNNIITKFEEKRKKDKGYINVGVYVIKKEALRKIKEEKFSIEKDYFEKYTDKKEFVGYIYDKEFIDIGIPCDYKKVCKILKNKN